MAVKVTSAADMTGWGKAAQVQIAAELAKQPAPVQTPVEALASEMMAARLARRRTPRLGHPGVPVAPPLSWPKPGQLARDFFCAPADTVAWLTLAGIIGSVLFVCLALVFG